MTDTENKALYIAEQCRKAGMTLAGTAGILANVEAESIFSPINLENSKENRVGMTDAQYTAAVDNGTYHSFVNDSAGYGLAQWTASDRKQGMLNFHRSRGKSIGDFETQVAWLLTELRSYTKAYNTCRNSNDPYQCGYDVCKYYEICDNLEAASQYRGGVAKRWYSWLQAVNLNETVTPVTPAEPTVQEPATPQPKEPKGKVGKMQLRTIDQGIEGWPEVWLAQAALKTRGYSAVSTGIFDSTMTKAVKDFQQDAFPTDESQWDGVIGPLTWAKLLSFL